MHRSHSLRRYLPPSLLLLLLMHPAQAEVLDYDTITGTMTLISASGPTPDSPVKITYEDGFVWNMYCREDAVGTTYSASAGLSVNTVTDEVTITYAGETFAVPSPVVYTGVGGDGIVVKASASESYFETTGPQVDTRYTDSANFMFLTRNIGREFTGTITEKQEYMRAGQVIATCLERYRIVGYVTPAPAAPEKEFSIINQAMEWFRDAVIDEDKSQNSGETRYTSIGVRG